MVGMLNQLNIQGNLNIIKIIGDNK